MRALIVFFLGILLFSPVSGVAQNAPETVANADTAQVDPQFGQRRNHDNPDEAKIQRDMAKERNKERQKELKEDTDKLLKLATELKEYVDKTNENILSVDVLKKTDEIDKLAKSVRDKMKAGGYDGVSYQETR